MRTLELRHARIFPSDELVTLTVVDGSIARITPSLVAGLPPPANAVQHDLGGLVVLPAFVDLLTHLDKTFCDAPNRSGTLLEAIDVWLNATHLHTRASVSERAERAILRALSHGTTAIRTHVDVVTRAHLESVEALLTLRERYRGIVDLQLVALGYAGRSADERALMEEALRMGVDFVGGAPALEPDPVNGMRAIVELAVKHVKPIDAHIDESEDPRSRTLETLAGLVIANGLHGRATAGHCVSLAFMTDSDAERIVKRVSDADLTIVTLPSCNLNLIGRGGQPAPRGVTRVKQLQAAGVRVVAASDNVRDPFNPFGDYNLLHIANLCAHTAHMSGVDELKRAVDMVGALPGKAFFARQWHVAREAPADFVVVEATASSDVLAAMPRCVMVVRDGRIVFDRLNGASNRGKRSHGNHPTSHGPSI
jgi:cytosine deaminase